MLGKNITLYLNEENEKYLEELRDLIDPAAEYSRSRVVIAAIRFALSQFRDIHADGPEGVIWNASTKQPGS